MAQHQDLLGQLASIRERQGLEPLPDPTKIQGPPPVFDPVAARLAEARSYPEDHLETPEPEAFDEPEQSPLVKIAKPAFSDPDVAGIVQQMIADAEQGFVTPPVMRPARRPFVNGQPELWMGDRSAHYKGRDVELNDTEYKAVVTVLLKALRRSLDEQYQEIAGRPMRQRKPKEAETPKRRGRAAKSAVAAGNPVGKA